MRDLTRGFLPLGKKTNKQSNTNRGAHLHPEQQRSCRMPKPTAAAAYATTTPAFAAAANAAVRVGILSPWLQSWTIREIPAAGTLFVSVLGLASEPRAAIDQPLIRSL
jgi:hypothetical protein